MATLIEKEVLIEAIAQVQAFVAKRVDVNAPLTEYELRLGEIRDFLYSNDPKDISYSSLLNEIKSIQKIVADKLIMPEYR